MHRPGYRFTHWATLASPHPPSPAGPLPARDSCGCSAPKVPWRVRCGRRGRRFSLVELRRTGRLIRPAPPAKTRENHARGRIFTDGESLSLGTIFASQCSRILLDIRSLRWAKSYDLSLNQSWNGPASFARPASSMSISSRRPIKPASVRTRTNEQARRAA